MSIGPFLKWNQETRICDWSATGTDLETAVLLLLFSDAAAAPDFKPADGDPRGWWASDIGSRLWQYERSPKDGVTLGLVIGEAQRSLQPLIAWGVASAVTVQGEWQSGLIALAIQIAAPDGTVTPLTYNWAWNQ